MKTVTTYILTSSLIAILTITSFGVYSLDQFQVNAVRKEHEKLETCIRTFWQLLAARGTDFRIVDGNLLAGTYRVNGNCELPDKVQEIFGGVATIFMGDERVATNVLTADGKRALGTRLVGGAYDAIFKRGIPYRGKASILGIPYLTAYDPIRDRTGNIIGVLFVGVKESELQARLDVLKMHLSLTLFGVVTIFSILMVLLTRAMKRVEHANEQQIRFQQQLFDIVEFLPDATFVIDRESRVIAWNRAIEEMTGVRKRDIVGKGDYAYAIPFYNDYRPLLIDLLDKEQERIRRNYATIKREGHTLFTEVFVPSFRNGDSRYFWATATPLFDKEGNPAGAIESIRDITEYKQAEEGRARLESQLHHARMLETFMVRLGHDLRTPLTPLFVLFPLIKGRVADPELLGMVEICCKSAASMKKLVDRAQMLVSLSAAIKAEEVELIVLVSAVDRALADNVDSMTNKHVACHNDIAPSIIVEGVPEQLREIFTNLISNAVRFSPGNGVIRIAAEQLAGTVTVAVHDDGIGLAPAHLERIFDEFFKADDSRHDLNAPGLGLSICKRIVLNHHGRIWAESPGIGKGTTIKFTLNGQCADIHNVKEPC